MPFDRQIGAHSAACTETSLAIYCMQFTVFATRPELEYNCPRSEGWGRVPCAGLNRPIVCRYAYISCRKSSRRNRGQSTARSVT